ncbi:hypothetical protein CANCADRAFT_2707 [Tortispora caseinolytica NRRL Y-17796]|uniref:Uncharacterized protein n=1 Tax=Tortispora caseinolytica NRRL Y-17796 TaxID=767744 RepID=A0A1E4TGV5_9ASCO|nr:hypothetical protein CANCADRAFT_2707 [Tortispora caseinolytica NRRL Y-17796]
MNNHVTTNNPNLFNIVINRKESNQLGDSHPSISGNLDTGEAFVKLLDDLYNTNENEVSLQYESIVQDLKMHLSDLEQAIQRLKRLKDEALQYVRELSSCDEKQRSELSKRLVRVDKSISQISVVNDIQDKLNDIEKRATQAKKKLDDMSNWISAKEKEAKTSDARFASNSRKWIVISSSVTLFVSVAIYFFVL